MTIAELAARQHGFVSRGQLLAAGASAKEIRQRVEVRRLHSVHVGVYSVAPPRLLRPNGRYMAAVLACGEGALLSHRAAAALLGLRPSVSPRIEVIAGRGSRGQPGLTIHTTRSLPVDDVSVSDDIPCTSVARTFVDLAAVVSHVQLRRALVRSLVEGRS